MSHQYNLPSSTHEKSNVLIPNTKNPSKAVEYINSYIDMTRSREFSVDISFMNIIDACYVSTLCSTKHYTVHPDGKIRWYVSSNLVKEFTKDMLLGNSEFYS